MGHWNDESLITIQEQITRLEEWNKTEKDKVSKSLLSLSENVLNSDLLNIKKMLKKQIELIDSMIYTDNAILEFKVIEEKKLSDLENSDPRFKVIKEFMDEWKLKEIAWYLNKLQTNDRTDCTKEDKKLLNSNIEEITKVLDYDFSFRLSKLIYQIKEKTGEVISCVVKRNANEGYDGLIKGEKANITIETIIAGGHNIQRIHYRTLLKTH